MRKTLIIAPIALLCAGVAYYASREKREPSREPIRSTDATAEARRLRKQRLSSALAASRMEESARVAEELAKDARIEDVPALLAFCDAAIEARRPAVAVPVWNALCDRRLLPATAIREHLLVNSVLGRGFGWRIAAVPGVVSAKASDEITFLLLGREPEHCELMDQVLALAPKQKFRFTWEARLRNMTGGSGLRWRVLDGQQEFSSAPVDANSLTFTVPRECTAPRLVLAYDRQPGQPLADGALILKNMDMVH